MVRFATICLMVANVESWLMGSSHLVSYVVIALLLLSSGVGAPMPEDLPLLAGGWLCRQGNAHLFVMLTVGWFFVLAGDCVLYVLGRRYGHHVPKLPGLRILVTEKRIARAEAFFEKHGGKTVFMMRFIAIARATTWFVAGALKIPFWKFIAYDGAAALVFAPGYILLGWLFADQWERVVRFTRTGQIALTLCVAGVVGGIVIWQIARHRRNRTLE